MTKLQKKITNEKNEILEYTGYTTHNEKIEFEQMINLIINKIIFWQGIETVDELIMWIHDYILLADTREREIINDKINNLIPVDGKEIFDLLLKQQKYAYNMIDDTITHKEWNCKTLDNLVRKTLKRYLKDNFNQSVNAFQMFLEDLQND